MPGPAYEQIPPSTVADLKAAIDILSREPEVRRVWLFGSLAKGRKPDFRSDMDLVADWLRGEVPRDARPLGAP